MYGIFVENHKYLQNDKPEEKENEIDSNLDQNGLVEENGKVIPVFLWRSMYDELDRS